MTVGKLKRLLNGFEDSYHVHAYEGEVEGIRIDNKLKEQVAFVHTGGDRINEVEHNGNMISLDLLKGKP